MKTHERVLQALRNNPQWTCIQTHGNHYQVVDVSTNQVLVSNFTGATLDKVQDSMITNHFLRQIHNQYWLVAL